MPPTQYRMKRKTSSVRLQDQLFQTVWASTLPKLQHFQLSKRNLDPFDVKSSRTLLKLPLALLSINRTIVPGVAKHHL